MHTRDRPCLFSHIAASPLDALSHARVKSVFVLMKVLLRGQNFVRNSCMKSSWFEFGRQ